MVEDFEMVEYFGQKMRECAALITPHLTDRSPDAVVQGIINGATYRNADETDFHYEDPLYNAIYMARYGYAYAYEYSTIYRIILEDYDDDIFGVTSLGCGSCIDAWALAYTNSKQSVWKSIRYAGTDLKVWGIQLKPEDGNVMERAYTNEDGRVRMRYPGMNRMQDDLFSFYDNNRYQSLYNTVLFPKILNELNPVDLASLLTIIRDHANEYTADRNRYICISHSRDAYNSQPAMRSIAREICDAINYDNRFTVDDTLPGRWSGLGGGRRLNNVSPGEYACYEFPLNQYRYYDRVEYLNSDFEVISEMSDVRNALDAYICTLPGRHGCVSSTSTSLFQIIKLSPAQRVMVGYQ